MTPPDSDAACRHECQCGYRVIGRDEMLVTHDANHTWSQCVPAVIEVKPDSDAREVCGICGRERLRDTPTPCPQVFAGDIDARIACKAFGYDRLAALVCVEPSLVQRILAALEYEVAHGGSGYAALASELRAVIGK